MKRSFAAAAGVAVVATLALAGCSGGGEAAPEESSGPVTLSLSGWSLDTTPEFQKLADAFHEENPDVTVELKGYDATEYNTLITADLAAGSGPDIITQKEVKFVPTFVNGGQLLDVSDVELPDEHQRRGLVRGRRHRLRRAVPQRLVGAVLQQGAVRPGRRRVPGRLVDVGRLQRRRRGTDRGHRRRGRHRQGRVPAQLAVDRPGLRERAVRTATSSRASTSTWSPSTTTCSHCRTRATSSTSTPRRRTRSRTRASSASRTPPCCRWARGSSRRSSRSRRRATRTTSSGASRRSRRSTRTPPVSTTPR